MKYSIVVPVFNRPGEIDELLISLVKSEYKDFEVIIVEDGSEDRAENIVYTFKDRLSVEYYFKENSGTGPSRNFGANRSKGDYIIFLDSDVIVPPEYLSEVDKFLNNKPVDAFGGPDMAHKSFTNIQKAINYSMTSFLTTGGIRGGKKSLDKFFPRSFNMGYTREVHENTGGFSELRFGEDIDMSIRILEEGFKTALIKNAAVYHKRRTNFRKFYKQVFNSGIARINLSKRHPGTLKIVHFFPSAFVIGSFACVLASPFWYYSPAPIIAFCLLTFIDSSIKSKSTKVGYLSIPASFIQLFGYGLGFIKAFWRRIILGKSEFSAFNKNFYK